MVTEDSKKMIGTVLAGQWEITDLLGEGGVGSVYLGQHLKLGTHVAIKVLRPEISDDADSIKRFVREVDILKRSTHPNIAVIHDCNFSAKNPYIVMEYLEGPTLKEVLDELSGRRLPLQRTRRVFTQILAALGTVHVRGIVHRDLKPENVFLLQLGGGRQNADVVKLIDFGIAKSCDDGTAAKPKVNLSLTQIGHVVGTPFYMAPEQCRGEPTVDGRADLYAVGVMLYEAACGRLPFSGTAALEIMNAHIEKCPDAPCMINPSISPEFEMVILRALAKSPEDRFQSAEEFSEALETAIPEDPAFYRGGDSVRVQLINGRSLRTPSRVPASDAEDDQPTAERPTDVSKTPTRLLSEKRPAAGLALAKTITPSDLAAQEAVLKWHEVWIGKVPTAVGRYLAAFLIFVVALFLSTVILPVGGGDAKASDNDAGGTATDAATKHDAVDVIVIQMPVMVPAPPSRDAGAGASEDAGEAESESPEADAGEDEAQSEIETEAANTPTPPDGYEELLRQGDAARSERNFLLAARRFKSATELWPEGSRGWRELGDAQVILGRRTEAKAAYQEYLRLAPNASDADSIRRRIERW